jgi:hypothetical protein
MNKTHIFQHISFLKKGFLEIARHSFAEDSQLILCFVCALGTGVAAALSATCLILEDMSLGLLCIGSIISIIFFAVFLYVAYKMD